MFDWLVETFTAYPYLGVAVVFVICGLGIPIPEELVLITAGYVCFKDWAELPKMIAACAVSILIGDLVPFFLGHTFGSRLLRLRPLRFLITRGRLQTFDRWFRKRGDLVIFFARFVTGLRLVAYFIAGTMKMSYRRFAILDTIGIAIVVPVLVWVGYRFGHIIDDAIAQVRQVERGILYAVLGVCALLAGWVWLRRQRRWREKMGQQPAEMFVGPLLGPPLPEDHASETAASPAPPAPERGSETPEEVDERPPGE